jgi:hypothetical protein
VQVSVGLALGVPAAIVSGPLIAGWLFDVRPWAPALLVHPALFLVAATLVAAFIPARRGGTASAAGRTHRITSREQQLPFGSDAVTRTWTMPPRLLAYITRQRRVC